MRLGRRRSGLVTDRHALAVLELHRAVLESPGHSDPSVRQAVFNGTEESLAAPVSTYLEKVREQSYRIIDRDIQAMKGAGLCEDVVFELTVAAALGAANRRLEAGLRKIRVGR